MTTETARTMAIEELNRNLRFSRSANPPIIGPQKVSGSPHKTGTSATRNGDPVISNV